MSGSERDATFVDSFKPVRLLAQDPDDLSVLSALLQDAVALTKDVAWMASHRRFALVVNRYRWEAPAKEERVRCGVHFDSVLQARSKGIDAQRPDQPIVILALTFEPGAEPPGGVLRIACAPDPATGAPVEITLELEAIEAGLRDMTQPWAAKGRPAHEVGGEDLA